MPDPRTSRLPIGAGAAGLYALAVAAYTLPFIAARELFYRDEVRYGGIVNEMMARGAWLTQTIAGEPYLDKGPVYFMGLRAGAELAGGPSPAAFLAVNAVTVLLFAIAAHVALRWLGTAERVAERAGLILLSLPFVAFYALTLRMDPLFAGAIVLSFAAYARALEDERPLRWFVAGGALAGLAVLIKGPFGIVFPIGGAVAAALLTGRARRLRSGGFALSLLVAAALVGVWFLALLAEFGWPALVNIAEVQLVERALNSVDGRKPWTTYIYALPLVLLPWLVLAPALRGAGAGRDRGVVLWAIYTIVALVVMQSVAQKSAKYLFPVLPPLTLCLAIALDRAEARAPWAPRAAMAVAAMALAGLFGALLWGASNDAPWLADALQHASAGSLRGFAIWGLAAAAVLALAVAVKGRLRVLAVIAATAVMFTGLKATLSDDLDRWLDPGPAVAMLEAALPPDAPVVVVDIYRGTFSWALDRPHAYVFGQDAAAEAVARAARPVGILVDAEVSARAPAWLDGAERVGTHPVESLLVEAYVLPAAP
ncbi:glycosyltransferase family 39 protein [Roseibacterium sp. SDUM158017]|uniref:ArnT family glycosyltransferase n=1 Tax=Roseicyclus salinarum TaxID=3036773 RepID=UPI00241558FF|nr:glycosyltransferase family 39 protein [Roseibacterium sp. SDUM158017]MDG4647974.1 glycosyltransferase family 39 protein [Roseibacterium sp. SDUM158017]